MNSSIEKTLSSMIFGALLMLALGLVTSPTILSLSHILMIFPALYFLSKTKLASISKSSWALLFMSLMIIASVLFNQDIALSGFKPILKVKYFLFGFISIAPLRWFVQTHLNEKKTKWLIYSFCLATTVATIAGIIGMKAGYNFISMREVNLDRNAGLSGMVLNYAHNLAYFQILVFGLIYFRKELTRIVDARILGIVFIINFIGLYLSFTRGAMLALLIGLPFYLIQKNKVKFLITTLSLFIIATGTYFYSGKSFLRPESDNERISQWRAAVKAFQERPVLGYGYLNFERYSVPIKERYNLGELQFGGHAHNNFLEMLASTGILGFIGYVCWLFFWLWESYRRNDLLGRISLPFIIVFIVSGLTQSTISLGVNLFFAMAVYAIGQANAKNIS